MATEAQSDRVKYLSANNYSGFSVSRWQFTSVNAKQFA